ncbi:pleckstrin homology domain-containing family N member 1 isoform X3 [Rousettus aegyptiacus]|uniref:Pleckstrin homology domain containing N1 n=1 Tax=Rousettus aegyptiacus TaxID=9407 RepID=A0A7J8KEQ6_ROUAE|nr:pleckstrin homology domain-containing family N member 1 isoform X3 [Rousettus aegyptiacus]KAF6507271.1 pleckstrin homology domain containing N1 [Rousettus aegyptiacus]
MGNSHCVPQAPRRLRASFSRKPSLKGNREDGTRKLAGLFGTEASPDADAAAGKIFYYIPGTDLPGLESQRESLEQPFLSVFKRGRRRVPVRSLGKVVHYAKVQLRFQHSQDVSDCYLELFPSHLYFQAHGSEGLTFQGLLPLMELSIGPLEESTEPAFQITGPLPAPLLVLCPSPAERDRWLYYLEKQMALAGGLRRCNSAPPQGPPEDELPWTLQRRLTRVRTASGRQAVGSAICASRVKLQHLPSQEQWDRLLVLYPTSLAIFSEEADGLCFKGELPLASIQVNLEEKEKQIRSFLIEGSLINTIRVLCASYEDYSRWLLCLQTVSRRGGAPLLPNPETFPGLRMPHQALGSGRGSLSSDGRTSWDSGYPGPPSTCTSHSLPESSALPTAGHPAQPVPLNLDCGPEGPGHAVETPHSPLYADPYTPPATSHHKITDVRGLDEFLSAVRSSLGPAPASPFPSVPVSVPVSDPSFGPCGSRLPSKKGALQPRASQRQRGSSKGRGPPDSPQLVSRLREGSPGPLLPPADGSTPRSYDNIWDKATSPPGQRRPRGATEAEGGFIQWI